MWGEEIPECFPEGGGLDLGIELDLSSLRRESSGYLHCLAKVFSLGYFLVYEDQKLRPFNATLSVTTSESVCFY